MDPIDQQNQDAISKVSLKHTVEANAHAIEVYRKESAEMCLKIKENIHHHHERLGRLLATLHRHHVDVQQAQPKLEKLLQITSEFYDKEHLKCCHSLKEETSFINTEDKHTQKLEDVLDDQMKHYYA